MIFGSNVSRVLIKVRFPINSFSLFVSLFVCLVAFGLIKKGAYVLMGHSDRKPIGASYLNGPSPPAIPAHIHTVLALQFILIINP
jgi:hypothetical protein